MSLLNREQVEEYGRNLSAAQFHVTATYLLAHDAALRTALLDEQKRYNAEVLICEQLRAENARLKVESGGRLLACIDLKTQLKSQSAGDDEVARLYRLETDLTTQLAAMTAERDKCYVAYDDRIMELESQLSTSQARCAELEKA